MQVSENAQRRWFDSDGHLWKVLVGGGYVTSRLAGAQYKLGGYHTAFLMVDRQEKMADDYCF